MLDSLDEGYKVIAVTLSFADMAAFNIIIETTNKQTNEGKNTHNPVRSACWLVSRD